MTSALSGRGSSRRWRMLRRRYAALLPAPCGRCGDLVFPGQSWDLGHGTARALGGTDTDLWPEHTACNRAAGGRLGAQLRATAPPSRLW